MEAPEAKVALPKLLGFATPLALRHREAGHPTGLASATGLGREPVTPARQVGRLAVVAPPRRQEQVAVTELQAVDVPELVTVINGAHGAPRRQGRVLPGARGERGADGRVRP